MNDIPPVLARKEACALLRIGKTKMDELIKRGDLSGFMLGARRMFRREEILAFLDKLSAKGA